MSGRALRLARCLTANATYFLFYRVARCSEADFGTAFARSLWLPFIRQFDTKPMLHRDSHATEAEQRYCRAKMLLADLLQLPSINKELEDQGATPAARVYTQAPTLWLLVLQRLGGGLTLDQAVSDLIDNHSDILPQNRRVTKGKLSKNNSAYNQARGKLPINVVEEFKSHLRSPRTSGPARFS